MTLRRLQLATTWGQLTVRGGSRAGEGTLILLPQLRLALDAGRMHRSLPSMSTVLLSHGHADHAGGLCYWASQRVLNNLGPGRVLAPSEISDQVTALLEACAVLEGGDRYPVTLVPVDDGSQVALSRAMRLDLFGTDHWVATLGCRLVWTRRRLKEHLTSEEPEALAQRRALGEEITRPVQTPLLSYSADSGPGIFERAEHISAEVMLVECSFWNDRDIDRARRFGHMHLADLVEHAPSLECRHLVLLHASRRNGLREVERAIEAELAPHVEAEVHHLIVDWE